MKVPLCLLTVIGAWICLCFAGVSIEGQTPWPFVRVPKAGTKPSVVKGLSLGEGFWEGCGFSGMTDFFSQSHIPWADAAWWLTYDDQSLYIAALVRTPDVNTGFVGTIKDSDDPRIIADDHLEIQISFEERDRAAQLPFYKLMINPVGTLYAAIVNWQPGQDRQGWASLVQASSHVQTYIGCQFWVAKLAVPLEQLGVRSLDNRKAILQLVYAPAGMQVYSGWVGASWMSWGKFGEVLFDRTSPAFSVNGNCPGELINAGGSMLIHNRFHVKAGEQPVTLHTAVDVFAEGAEALRKSFVTAGLRGGGKAEIRERLTARIHQKNDVAVELKQRSATGDELLLYQCAFPFRKPDSVMQGTFESWRKFRRVAKEPSASVDFAYFPYFDKVRVRVDADIGVELVSPEKQDKARKVRTADGFKGQVIGSDKAIHGTAEGKVEKFRGTANIALSRKLPEGTHTLRVDVTSGGEVVDTVTKTFVRECFPWERNTIGKERVVIPPYIPVEVQGNVLRVWGREYTLADTGFFSQITSEGKPLLSEEITLQSTQGGREFVLQPEGRGSIEKVRGQKFPSDFIQYWYKARCPKPQLEPTDGYQAIVRATSRLGTLRVEVEGTMEYEGFYRVKLKLVPQGNVSCDRVDMVVPMSSVAHLMRFSRNYALVGYGRIPDGEGVLFASTSLPKVAGFGNSFVPKIFLGNYSRGLWWMADSDQGWVVEDEKPLAQLERAKGQVLLRLRLVNKPCVLSQPREIEFALQAVPMKPKPQNYRRIAWKLPEPQFAHDTSGARYYGLAMDGFTLDTDEDYEGLRRFYHEVDIKKNHLRPLDAEGKRRWWGMSWLEPARKGHPLVEYGSTWVAALGMKETPTFLGEWTYSNDAARLLPEEAHRGKTSYGGTYTWTRDEDITEVTATFNESLQDCFVWHMTRLAAKAHINGTFYDNYTDSFRVPKIDTDIAGDAYVREDGQVREKASTFRRHYLTKRLATALWLLGRPPFQLVAWEQDVSFAEASWFVEGPWYINSPAMDYIDLGLTPAVFQATTCKPGQIGYLNTQLTPFVGKDGKKTYRETAQRLVLAYCLLNDLGCIIYYLQYPQARAIVDKLATEVRFFDGAGFLPYWEDAEWVTGLPKDVVMSAYVHPERAKAVLVLLNATENSFTLNYRLDGRLLLGRDVTKLSNLETGSVVATSSHTCGPFNVERHQVALLLVE